MMPVCIVCGADGVLDIGMSWYCTDHLENALLVVVSTLAHHRGWDVEESVSLIRDWLAS